MFMTRNIQPHFVEKVLQLQLRSKFLHKKTFCWSHFQFPESRKVLDLPPDENTSSWKPSSLNIEKAICRNQWMLQGPFVLCNLACCPGSHLIILFNVIFFISRTRIIIPSTNLGQCRNAEKSWEYGDSFLWPFKRNHGLVIKMKHKSPDVHKNSWVTYDVNLISVVPKNEISFSFDAETRKIWSLRDKPEWSLWK